MSSKHKELAEKLLQLNIGCPVCRNYNAAPGVDELTIKRMEELRVK